MWGELVIAGAALGAASSALVAFSPSVRNRRHRAGAADVDAKARLVMFRAIDEGDLAPADIAGLTPVELRSLEVQTRALLPKLKGEDRETLGRIVERLGAVDAARRQTTSKRAVARAQAGEFLGESGSPEAVRDLLRLLEDPDPKVRWAAARGLGRLGHPSAVAPLLASIEGSRAVPVDVIADAIFQIRECPVPLLRQGLDSPSGPTRAVTVELLGRFQVLAAVDDLVGLLGHDPSAEVRARAARSLGRMGSPRAIEGLLPCVAAGPVAMRAQAIWALGEIGAAEALPVLRDTVLGPTHHLSELAADALVAMGPLGLGVLAEIAAGEGGPATTAARALATHRLLQPSRA